MAAVTEALPFCEAREKKNPHYIIKTSTICRMARYTLDYPRKLSGESFSLITKSNTTEIRCWVTVPILLRSLRKSQGKSKNDAPRRWRTNHMTFSYGKPTFQNGRPGERDRDVRLFVGERFDMKIVNIQRGIWLSTELGKSVHFRVNGNDDWELYTGTDRRRGYTKSTNKIPHTVRYKLYFLIFFFQGVRRVKHYNTGAKNARRIRKNIQLRYECCSVERSFDKPRNIITAEFLYKSIGSPCTSMAWLGYFFQGVIRIIKLYRTISSTQKLYLIIVVGRLLNEIVCFVRYSR